MRLRLFVLQFDAVKIVRILVATTNQITRWISSRIRGAYERQRSEINRILRSENENDVIRCWRLIVGVGEIEIHVSPYRQAIGAQKIVEDIWLRHTAFIATVFVKMRHEHLDCQDQAGRHRLVD